MEKKTMRKPVKIGIAAAVLVLLAAGVSVYAVGTSAGGSASISEDEAKQIALAEVKGADVSDITKFKKDSDDGRMEYDVEIVYGGYEYDFEISAEDGTIFDRSKEIAEQNDMDDNSDDVSGNASGNASAEISLERAKEIALAQVSGASAGDITNVHSEYDDGVLEYDIEIRYNGYEYDFEIDGMSGNIVSKDVDSINEDMLDD